MTSAVISGAQVWSDEERFFLWTVIKAGEFFCVVFDNRN